MHERGRVHELDGDTAAKRALAIRRGEVNEQRTKPLATGVERVGSHLRDHAGVPGGRLPQARLELVEVRLRLLEDRLRFHRRPTWSETMPPASRR